MNINAALVHAYALAYVEKKAAANGEPLRRHEIKFIDLRVYTQGGQGFYFIPGYAPGKWYYDEQPNDGHYNNCPSEDVEAAITSGGKIQIVGVRGISLGLWQNWGKFSEEVLS